MALQKLPQKISVANYRAFADLTTLELRPLTLLYGWNNVGKSALLRLLPLIGDSVSPRAGAPLELLGEAGQKSSFLDVKWKGERGDAQPLLLRFEWTHSERVTRVDFGLDFSREWQRTFVKRLSIFRGEQRVLDATHVPDPSEQGATALNYDVQAMGQAERRLALEFEGMLPRPLKELPILDDLRELLLELRGQIQWLGSLRHSPEKFPVSPGSAPTRLSADGTEAAQVLRMDPGIRAEVSGFYQRSFNRLLELQDLPPTNHFRMVLRSLNTTELAVDLVYSGEGLLQLMPVLVALAMTRRHASGGPSILAVEEPESHLHPNAQRELARHLCGLAASDSPPMLVLETHSFPLLLAIQVEIARGRLPHDRVIAYWVEQSRSGWSVARPVTFDKLGQPEGNWPADVFADEHILAVELLKAQREAATRQP